MREGWILGPENDSLVYNFSMSEPEPSDRSNAFSTRRRYRLAASASVAENVGDATHFSTDVNSAR